jgi:hypothetical protein
MLILLSGIHLIVILKSGILVSIILFLVIPNGFCTGHFYFDHCHSAVCHTPVILTSISVISEYHLSESLILGSAITAKSALQCLTQLNLISK